jgi:hypothetical protein
MHALLGGLVVVVLTQTPPAAAQPKLPLKSLTLYENGVGYFERRGLLGPHSVAEIPLEAGQLDDVLKSLVMVSDARVASVEFAPPLSVEAARAMAGMPEPEAQRSLENLLRALQGVDVQVSRDDGARFNGRVLEVSAELGAPDKEGKREPEPTLLIFGEAGLVKVSLSRLVSVRPTGSQVSLAWSRAVGATSLQPDRERLLVRGSSAGGAVAVGYTTEAPVWRTTYRLVMGSKARLQGFALVHNDSDEPWNGVRVSLASGRPTSFLFPLAGPRYGRRDLVAPQDGLSTAPQLATREAREHLRGSLEEREGTVGMGYGTLGSGSGGGGYGVAQHALTVRGAAAGISSTVLEDGPTPIEPAAVSEAGDLFLYTVKEPVVLGARQSALLPIIDGAVAAERVTVLDAEGAAFTAVRLQNSTPLTLEGGTLSVFADAAYAGETQVDRVKPGEVRVLRHGVDLDLVVTRSTSRDEGPVRKARLTGLEGARILELTRVDSLVHHVSFSSRATVARTVLVTLPEDGYRVVHGGEEDVRSPGQPRYGRLMVAPKSTEDVDLVEEGAVVERIAAASLTSARVTALLSRDLPAEARALLLGVKAEVDRAEAAEVRVVALDAKLKVLESDQARLREDLGALNKGLAPAVAQKVAERLLALEDELQRLRREREATVETTTTVRRRLLLAAK